MRVFEILLLLMILLGLYACWLFPLFRFAPLQGPHPVGTSILHLTDTSRIDDAAPSPCSRELMVQVWYPAAASKHKLACYRRKEETTARSSYQAFVRTRSRLDVPLLDSDRRLPVLLFNPAWNGRRTQSTFLTQELASHGFVVVAIDHTYNSEPVAFPDGRVVQGRHERAMEDVNASTVEAVRGIGEAEVRRQVLDGRFVLDELARWDQQEGSRWHGRLNTAQAGALGHSIGGAVAVECWAVDNRFIAAMNMDGWCLGSQVPTGKRASLTDQHAVASPLLFVYEEDHPPSLAFELATNVENNVEKTIDAWDAANVCRLLAHYGGYWLNVKGANHLNFTDRPLSSPWRRLSGGGPIQPRLAHRLLCAYAVEFFQQALLGIPSTLLHSTDTAWPEVTQHSIHALSKELL